MAEVIGNVEFFLPGESSDWRKINEFQTSKNKTVLFFSMEDESNDFFSVSTSDVGSEQERMLSWISSPQARVVRFEKDPSRMLSETIFEKNGVPNSYVCCLFLVDKGNTSVLT